LTETLQVRVIFAATPSRQLVRDLRVPAGATVADAIRLSGIGELAGLADAGLQAVGIFGRRVDPATPLHDGDRVEIYRPLLLDPKEARRRRAARQVRS
jgi:putative ubiquitin-RnfH superfamily antitoxin RatB of RatAB toxin-antitoxin module